MSTVDLTSYSGLQAAIATWLARNDLTDQIPAFISLAEAKFNRDLSVRQMEQRSTTSVDTASTSPEFITLPTYFRSMRWVRLSGAVGKPRLEYKTPTQLDEYRTGQANVTRQPACFTILSSEIELCPTPDSNYTIEMVYRKYIPALSNSNTTNWLLTLAPDLYLYGALVEAAAFNQNDARLAMWGQGYQTAIDGLNRLHISSAFNSGPVAMSVTGVTP